jgi:chemotaxis family two-component system sensor kinase Cph1
VGYSLVEAEIKLGEHLCSFYENKEEQFQIVFPFIVEGLARNEKCLYIADENSVDEVKAGLLIHGIDVEECLKTGQLNIRTTKESYLKHGRFILNDMILQIDSFVYRAINEGYSGVRVAGEVTWLIRELSYLEEFLEYEKTLNEVFRNRPVKLLCQYNSKKLFGNVILGALRTHPRVLIGLSLYKNVYYERTKPIRRRKKAKI